VFRKHLGLNTPDGKRVDLMPFGGIEENGEVVLKGKGMTSIKLEGFEEVFMNGSIDNNIEKDAYRAFSIPGIVILKLIAYGDRSDRRIKDIHDVGRICRHYPDLESDVVYEDHLGIFDDDYIDFHDKGHIVLGREMARIININTHLKSRIVRVLNDAIIGKSHITIQMISDPGNETIEEMIRIIINIKLGLNS
jgi:predicted nucleotidyltransferase